MPRSKKIIAEAGGAATALIDKKLSQHPDNAGRDLQYGRITDEELDSIFPKQFGVFPGANDDTYIGRMLYVLGEKGLIDTSYTPSYSLGSTRLAALKHYGRGSIGLDKYETDDVIATASGKKTDYGDMDIDLAFVADKREIAQAIEEINPAVFAASLSKEVNLAVRIGEKVIQIDLVDVSGGKDAQSFLWKSSFVDLADGIKGAFSILLLRSVAAVMEIGPEDTLDSIVQYAEENPESAFAKDFNKKLKLNYHPVHTRFSLGDKGLKLVVDMEKPSKKDPNKLTQAKIDFDPTVRQSFENLDDLAKIVLQHSAADASTIYSASKLAEFVKTHFSRDRIDLLWQSFEAGVEKNLRKKIDPEEYEVGMASIGKTLGKEWSPTASSLNEGRAAIGRFVGKNKFTNKNMMLLLRALVKETGNEGNPRFRIDMGTSPVVDMVEKMDSTFANFGVDANGEFFMESSNSGPVTKDVAEERFGFNPDLYESFKWLSNSEAFQTSMQKIFKTVGPFKYDAELFPILTHKGDAAGNVIFVGTPYSKDKMGEFGGFVVFKTQLWNDDELSWYRPGPEENVTMTSLIKKASFSDKWAGDWRVYTNEEDMKHNVKLDIELDPTLVEYLGNDEKFVQGLEAVTSRKKTPEKEELLFSLNRVREVLQDKLNTYAATANSVLGDDDSYIEGVVLRIKEAGGDIFEVKGTSPKFDEKKDQLWAERVNILNLEKQLENRMMLEVLELKTAHPATLNKAVRQVAETFSAQAEGDDAKVEFIKELLPVISDKTTGFNKVKPAAISLLNEIQTSFEAIQANFEQTKDELDVDSVRKTYEFLTGTGEKIEKFKTAIKTDLESMSFYVYMIGLVIGHRIDRFVTFGKRETPKDDVEHPKLIIWNGRAQPWHKGHDAMVQKGKSLLGQLGAEVVYIMIVKGGKASGDKSTNPLSEEEQIELISTIYSNDSQVVVHPKAISSSFIGVIANVLYKTGNQVAGWLAGADRINDYRKMLKKFDPNKWEGDHTYVPFDVDETGESTVAMIETPRVMSGTKARELANQAEVSEWIDAVAPDNIDEAAQQAYVEVYERLRNPELSEIVFDTIKEMSSAAGGAVGGYAGTMKDPDADDGTLIREDELEEGLPGFVAAGSAAGSKRDDDKLLNPEGEEMDRETFMQETMLRKYIRRAISIVEVKNEKQRILQENSVRKYVRKLILEAEEDHPHDSTGINVLEDLLKKIVPVFEKDYKSLTTEPGQRQSFRAHIVNAVQNSLAPSRAEISASPDQPPAPAVGMTEQEDEIEMDIPTERDLDPKFIDIEPEKKTEPEIPPEEKFGISGEDETGRNVAMKSWDQVETAVIDSFNVLSNAQDRELFYDYLITNLKLYFDKFEEELSAGVREPESEIYQQQQAGGDDLGGQPPAPEMSV